MDATGKQECPLDYCIRHLNTIQRILDNRGIAEKDDFCLTLATDMRSTLDDMDMHISFCTGIASEPPFAAHSITAVGELDSSDSAL